MNAYVFATTHGGIHRKTMLVFSSFDKLVEHAIEVGKKIHFLENKENIFISSFVAFKFKMNELKKYKDITEDVLEEMENRGIFDHVKLEGWRKKYGRNGKWLRIGEK